MIRYYKSEKEISLFLRLGILEMLVPVLKNKEKKRWSGLHSLISSTKSGPNPLKFSNASEHIQTNLSISEHIQADLNLNTSEFVVVLSSLVERLEGMEKNEIESTVKRMYE